MPVFMTKELAYDLETVFEGLNTACTADLEVLFMDCLISGLRYNPQADLTELTFASLSSLGLLGIEESPSTSARHSEPDRKDLA